MANSRANSAGLDLQLDLQLESDAGRRRPRVRAAVEANLREAISSGRLSPGTVLPPSRALATDLGIARNSVAEAYAQLVAEGWLVGRQGSATTVADHPDHPDLPSEPEPPAPTSQRPPRYDLRAGFPDVTSFPRSEWLAAARTALAKAPSDSLGYGPAAGLPQLRSALAGYLSRARGVRVTPGNVAVCAGFSSGLALLANVLASCGIRTIGVEAYGHRSHRAVLAEAGLQLVPLPVDEHGAVPDGLEHLDAVLLTPAHQFPLGVALSPDRRAQFTSWAVRTGTVIIEDDYDGEFRYDRRALGALQALAPEHVVYAGTASKALTPGLRLGWLVLPSRLAPHAMDRGSLLHLQAGAVEQLTLAEFIETGRYDRHIRRSRLAYRRRRDRLVAGLARRTPQLGVSGMNAGLHTVVSLPAGTSEAEIVEAARGRDLAVEGLAGYCVDDRPQPNALVVGYATPAPHAYSTALARLLTTLSRPASTSR
jgi:GntR family transcriptional regulator / MocR family aminotransferase